MSTPAAQVRVRLSAEGVRDVVESLKQVERQASATGTRGVSGLNAAFRELKGLLPALGLGTVILTLTSLSRRAFEAADAMGDAAERAGVTVETMSRLAFAAQQSDVEFSTLTTAIRNWQKTLSEAGQGTKTATDALAALGLKASDLKNLGLEDQLALIADRFKTIKNPADRTRIAIELFKNGGEQMIPLLLKGAEGVRQLTEEFDRLGGTLSTSAVQGIDRMDKAVKRLKATLSGKFQNFLGQASLAILGTGDKKIDEFTDRIVELSRRRNQLTQGGTTFTAGSPEAEELKTISAELAEVIKQRQIYLDQQAAIDASSAGGDVDVSDRAAREKELFDLKTRELELAGREREVRIRGLDEEIAKRREALQAAGQLTAEDERRLTALRTAGIAQIDADLAKKAAAEAQKRADAAKRIADDAEKARKAEADRETAAAQTRLDLEQRILEITGHAREARLSQLDEEIAKIRQVLAAANGGKVPAADEAKIQQFRATNVANLDFEDAIAKAQAGLDDLARQRERIEQDVQLGISTQTEGQERILEIEQQRLITLQQLAAAALAAAKATGSPEAIAQAQAISDAVNQVNVSVLSTQTSLQKLGQAGQDAFAGGLADLLGNLRSFSDVGGIFTSLAATVASALQRMAAEMLAASIQAALFRAAVSWFGGSTGAAASSGASAAARGIGPYRRGGVVGYAGGGPFDATGGGRIRGPGTGTSDSIPAITTRGRPLLVSNGEFIVREAVVRQPGMKDLLHTINAGRLALDMVPRRMPRGFAEGGAVSGDAAPAKAGRPGFAGVLGLEEGLVMRHLESEAFDKLLVRKIERNRTSVRSVIG